MQPQQNQPPIESYPSNYGSQPNTPDAGQRKLVLGAVVGGVVLVILLFFLLFTGGDATNIDRLILRERNLLTIAQTAQNYNTGFEAERVISNTIILVKGDLSALDSYRDAHFRRKIDRDVTAEISINSSELESTLSTAKQLDRLNSEIVKLYNEEINAILTVLDGLKTSDKQLQETFNDIEQNLDGIKTELELLDSQPE